MPSSKNKNNFTIVQQLKARKTFKLIKRNLQFIINL